MFAKRTVLIVLFICAVVLALGIGLQSTGTALALTQARAANPTGMTIPYSGRLANDVGKPAADGAYDFTFALYDAETGGTRLWAETQSGVKVAAGDFVTALGNVNPIPVTALEGDERWLAVQMREPGAREFAALTPRQQLNVGASAPQAAPAAAAACPHDHLGEVWNANIGWSNAGLKINNSSSGPAFWGTNSSGGNGLRGTGFGSALGVYGESDSGSGVAGRSTSGNAVEGDSPNGHGVVGRFGTGLLNIPQSGSGVLGQSTWIGVQGIANGSNSWGVYSVGDLGTSGNLYVTGLAVFSGGKSGYVVDVAQNDDGVSLVLGDVVVISGAAPAVLGEIPVIKVRRATGAEMNGVVGVVDQHLIPPPKQRSANSTEKAESTAEYTPATPGMYVTVVTLGSFKAIKVDASNGAINPGDLLVTSSNPGYAMKATSPKPGTIIGKALGTLTSGTGVIPVIITLQ